MTTKYPPGAPMWVDIGTTDVPGAQAFYGGLFGWAAQDMGPDAGGYSMMTLDGKMVAGMGPATDPERGTSWSIYLATPDLDGTTAKVEANGGKVIVPPMEVMSAGRMAVYTDPTGAFFSAWEPAEHQGAELTDVHGSMSWAELMTSDIDAVKAFYTSVFPLSTSDMPAGEGMVYTLFKSGDQSVAGAMNGGTPMSYWSVYFAVDDCDATADKAISLGASEMLRQDSSAGRFSVLTDPQGGVFGLIQNDPTFSV